MYFFFIHFSLPLGVAAPFAKDSPLFELFNEELSKMRESGQIGQVNTKYQVKKEGVKCSDGKVCIYQMLIHSRLKMEK